MSTADTIYELVKALPEEQANMVLMFTRFMQNQASQPQETQGDIPSADHSDWPILVHELAGTWSDFPDAKALRANLGQDVRRELL